jgi:hypothetical protein
MENKKLPHCQPNNVKNKSISELSPFSKKWYKGIDGYIAH